MAPREVFGTIGLVDKNVTGGVRLARSLRRDARHQIEIRGPGEPRIAAGGLTVAAYRFADRSDVP